MLNAQQPTPLLLIIASFDPNNNGINDYDPEHPELLYDPASPIYGEQWAISKPEDYYETFFAPNGHSLQDFYKEMTMGKFYFYPLHIDHPIYEGQPEGVIPITVPLPHPSALKHLGDYTNETAAEKCIHDIVAACDPYIDFAKYDRNGDGKITPDEVAIVIFNAGYDRATTKADESFSKVVCENGPIPSHRFMVHGTSQYNDIEMRGGVHIVKVSNVGEYNSNGPITIGTPAHELAHNEGAQDMYSRYTGPNDWIAGWPMPLNFSLMSSGNHLGEGRTPAYIDPYQRHYLGWADEVVAEEDGEYTLHSTLSGKYKTLKIPSPNPQEYFIAEIRLKEGFERNLTPGDSKGGVIFWHIDEKINEEWFTKAQCVSHNRPNGQRHDLGNAILVRNMFEEINDENGNFVHYGPCFKQKGFCEDPFFYKSDDEKTSHFDSSLYCGAASLSYSLNNFPEGTDKNWKLIVDVLDEPGETMRIRIKRG